MTEKRFTIQGQSIKHNDELLTLNMVCEMLNDYAEENKQLKSDMRNNYKKYKELLDENELLKQELDYWKKRTLLLEKKYDEGDSIKWLRENTVWEVMPSNHRTYTSTKYYRRNDE